MEHDQLSNLQRSPAQSVADDVDGNVATDAAKSRIVVVPDDDDDWNSKGEDGLNTVERVVSKDDLRFAQIAGKFPSVPCPGRWSWQTNFCSKSVNPIFKWSIMPHLEQCL